MTESRKNLFAALAKAQQSAKGVEKSKQVAFGNRYKYASGEDVVAEARRAMAAEGLAFTVTAYSVSSRDGMLWLSSRYLLTHSSGESLEITSETPVIPDKGRPEDKATATAKTYDLSYSIRGVLLLERVDEDHEVDARDDTRYEPKQRPAAQQIQEEAKPADPWAEGRKRWIGLFGEQGFADLVGCDVAKVWQYAPPADQAKRAALRATLESARRDLEAA